MMHGNGSVRAIIGLHPVSVCLPSMDKIAMSNLTSAKVFFSADELEH